MRKVLKKLLAEIKSHLDGSADRQGDIDAVRQLLFEQSDQRGQPVDRVRWVPIENVIPNDYNPNNVAGKEMQLLYVSIKADGYTQPIVTIFDETLKKYVIVDGFHRYFVGRNQADIREAVNGMLPIVVIDKSANERMAATVRHNRARGEHSIAGMGNLVFSMLQNGMTDAEVCNEIGLEPEELLKLKHITGFSKLFVGHKYNKAWETDKMIKLRKSKEGG